MEVRHGAGLKVVGSTLNVCESQGESSQTTAKSKLEPTLFPVARGDIRPLKRKCDSQFDAFEPEEWSQTAILPPIWLALRQMKEKIFALKPCASRGDVAVVPQESYEVGGGVIGGALTGGGIVERGVDLGRYDPPINFYQHQFYPGEFANGFVAPSTSLKNPQNPPAYAPETQLVFTKGYGYAPYQPAPAKDEDGEQDVRVTIYNPREQRKLSGNAAPFKRNLAAYLALHPVRKHGL